MYCLYMTKNKTDIESIILHYLQESISEDEMKILQEWLDEKKENKVLFFQTKEVYELRNKGLYPTQKEIQESKERLFSKIREEENKGSNKLNFVKEKQKAVLSSNILLLRQQHYV